MLFGTEGPRLDHCFAAVPVAAKYSTTEPKKGWCRESCGESSIGTSMAGTPVKAKATPCSGYGCVSERMTVVRSITFAMFGNSSQTWQPGSDEGITPNWPRISTGASGFGSTHSSWLGEP